MECNTLLEEARVLDDEFVSWGKHSTYSSILYAYKTVATIDEATVRLYKYSYLYPRRMDIYSDCTLRSRDSNKHLHAL